MTDMDCAGAARAALDSTRCAIVALALWVVTPCALAHAVVTSSEPARDGVVAPGELDVRVAFSSRIDPARSRLVLVAPDGAQTPLSIVERKPGVVTAKARAAAKGRWVLHWQVLSLDGHVTRGDVPFRVEAGNAAQ
jgi:methionine-rich copper-binding protein CopC